MTTPDTPWLAVVPTAWPTAPEHMSVSTHAEIEECPRRWALGAADYPDLWGGRGYPPRLQLAALSGTVVHLALEIITKGLVQAGAPSQEHPLATQVLREMGGISKVVQECLERVLARFANNPRAIALLEHARRTLRGQVPALRTRVQSIIARLRLPSGVSASTASATDGRRPLGHGAHPEIEVRALRIGWKGRVDLLALTRDECEITDFKTGAVDESHKLQVQVYAVLWVLDDELNPSARRATRLVLAYEGRDIEVQAPTTEEIESLTNALVERKSAAEKAIAASPPAARPDAETCRYCSVRHLCAEYWAASVPPESQLGDVELKITAPHGPTSWDAVVVRSPMVAPNTPVLFRLQQPTKFRVGQKLRVLEGALARDPEDDRAPLVVTLGSFSETFRVE